MKLITCLVLMLAAPAAAPAAAHADAIGHGVVTAPPPGVFSPPPMAPRETFTLLAQAGPATRTTGAIAPGQSVVFGFADLFGAWGVITIPHFYLEIRDPSTPVYRVGVQLFGEGLYRPAGGGSAVPCQIVAWAVQAPDPFGLSGTTGRFLSIGVYPVGTFAAGETNFTGGVPEYETYGWATTLAITVP